MKKLLSLLFVIAACGGSSIVDVNTLPIEGTWALSSFSTTQTFFPGDFDKQLTDTLRFQSGAWNRKYTGESVHPNGTRTPYSGTLSGTYARSNNQITLHRTGAPDELVAIVPEGLRKTEGVYVYTFARP